MQQACVEIEMRLSASPQIQTVKQKDLAEVMENGVIGAADRGAPVAFKRLVCKLVRGGEKFKALHGCSAANW